MAERRGAVSGLPEREEERAGSRSLGPIAFGVAFGLLLHLGVGAIPASSGEPALLRWLRVLADHPVRASLAAALAIAALSRRATSH